MYKRKRSVSRAPSYKKRRTTRFRYSRPKSLNYYRMNMVHAYKRRTSQQTIQGGPAQFPVIRAYDFRFSNVINVNELTALYDFYQLNYIVMKFYFTTDPGAQPGNDSRYPRAFWFIDYDDATAPSSLDQFRENTRCKTAVMTPQKPIVIKLRPAVLSLQFAGVTSNYTPKWRQWLDTSAPNTPHYGLKFAIDDLQNENYYVNIETTYYFKCKQPN